MSLPESWRELRLGDVCQIGSGDGAPQEEHWFSNNGEPFIRVSDLSTTRDDSRIYSSRDKVTSSAIEQLGLRKWSKDSLLLPKSGASALLNQRALLGVDACVVSHLAILRPMELIDADFLYWWSTKFDAARVVPDPSYPSIRLQDLARIKIALPTLLEQNRIVTILKQSEVVTKLRHDFDQLLFRAKRQLFIEMFGDPNPRFNKSWPVVKLGKFVEVATGGTPSRPQADSYGSAYAWVKSTDLKDNLIDTTEERISELGIQRSNAKLFPPQTIMLAMYGQGQTRGRTGKLLIDAACNQACAALLPSGELLPDYLWIWLQLSYDVVRSLGRGGQQENLNLDIVRSIQLPKPPVPLQQEFSRRLDALLGLFKKSQIASNQLSELLRVLQVEALTGNATAIWREQHADEILKGSHERDNILREHGTKINSLTAPPIPEFKKTELPIQPARQWLFEELGEFQRQVLAVFIEYCQQSGQPLLVEDPEVLARFCDDSAVVERLDNFGESLGNRIRRTLSQLSALGLIAKVTLPKRNLETGELDYLKAFRPLRSDEHIRMADLISIRNSLSPQINYYFSVQLDYETSDRAGAGGMFQVISIEDDDGKEFTHLVDQGKHYASLDALKMDIARALRVEAHQVDLEEV